MKTNRLFSIVGLDSQEENVKKRILVPGRSPVPTDTFKRLLYYIHPVIPIAVACLVFLPRKRLLLCWWTPVLIQLQWLVCNGCILTKMHNPENVDGWWPHWAPTPGVRDQQRLKNLFISVCLIVNSSRLLYTSPGS